VATEEQLMTGRDLSVRTPTRVVMWVLLGVITLLFMFPFVYLISTSVKTPLDSIAIPPTLLPTKGLAIDNYVSALGRAGVAPALINSFQIAVISAFITLVFSVPAAYLAGFFAPRIGRGFLLFALIVRVIPPVVVAIPYASFINDIGLSDTPLSVAMGQAAVSIPLTVWLLAGFFEAVPRELHDAALVDGCNRLQAMVRIVIPLVTGGIAVGALFAFLGSWNDYLFALLLTATRSQTMPIAIANFQTQYGLDWGPMTALSVVYTLPVVVLTLFLQRRIVAGMTLGSVRE
jgi:multiple sugar transport system permease protein